MLEVEPSYYSARSPTSESGQSLHIFDLRAVSAIPPIATGSPCCGNRRFGPKRGNFLPTRKEGRAAPAASAVQNPRKSLESLETFKAKPASWAPLTVQHAING
jgi:hypothetical protein